jgi:hypothetical protein
MIPKTTNFSFPVRLHDLNECIITVVSAAFKGKLSLFCHLLSYLKRIFWFAYISTSSNMRFGQIFGGMCVFAGGSVLYLCYWPRWAVVHRLGGVAVEGCVHRENLKGPFDPILVPLTLEYLQSRQDETHSHKVSFLIAKSQYIKETQCNIK